MRILIMALSLTALISVQSNAFEFSWPGGKKAVAGKKAEGLYRQAKSAYGSADYAKVIKLTTQAVKADSDHAKAYALRGKAKKDMGDVDGAFADLNQAIKLDPELGEAYYIRAQANEIMGQMDKAGQDYKKACSIGYKSACN